jgi:hypothetical protein
VHSVRAKKFVKQQHNVVRSTVSPVCCRSPSFAGHRVLDNDGWLITTLDQDKARTSGVRSWDCQEQIRTRLLLYVTKLLRTWLAALGAPGTATNTGFARTPTRTPAQCVPVGVMSSFACEVVVLAATHSPRRVLTLLVEETHEVHPPRTASC